MKSIHIITTTLLLSSATLYAQAPNDNCDNASLLTIPDQKNKLSILVDFEVSTPSYVRLGDCGNDYDEDLWYPVTIFNSYY